MTRKRHLIKICLLFAILGGSLLAGSACLGPSSPQHISPSSDASPLGTLRSRLRPDHVASRYSYGNVPAKSFPSAGGSFRVWWATSGVHAPLQQDANNNQVPDIVELVAKIADEIEVKVKEASWRWPIPENPLIPDPKNYGGDGRIDIYLYQFQDGDGKFEVDACRKQGNVEQCTGYIILQKDFLLSSYKSNEEGIRVVLSHEFFHMIQAAYIGSLPGWWSEGSATWFEEHFYPPQNDFERLVRYYLIEPHRSLDDRQRGPTDTFAYGTGLFVYYLAEKLTSAAIGEIMEIHATGTALLGAIDQAAKKRNTSLTSLFEGFAVRNLFTGTRTVRQHGYSQAGELAEAPVQEQTLTQFNWDVQLPLMAARYGRLQVTRPLTLTLKAINGYQPLSVFAVTQSAFAQSDLGTRLQLDQALRIEPTKEPFYLVFANANATDAQAARIEVRHASASPPSEAPSEPAPSDGGTHDVTPETTNSPDAGSPDTTASPDLINTPEPPSEASTPPTGCGCQTTPTGLSGLIFSGLLLLFGLLTLRRRPT